MVKDALCVSMCCGMSDHRYSKHQTDKQSKGQTDRQTQLSSVTYSNNNKACYLGVLSKGLVGGWVRGGGGSHRYVVFYDISTIFTNIQI